MKKFLFGFVLLLSVTVRSLAQDPCPGSLEVQAVDNLSVACGITANVVLTVYLPVPNANVSYAHGPFGADCFQLPSGWTYVSTNFRGNVNYLQGLDYEKYEITLTPGQFTGGIGKVRNKSTCGTPTTTYSNWFNFSITRTKRALSVTGANLICAGGSATVSVANQPGDGNFNWINSSNIIINTGQNTSSVNLGSSGNGSGFVMISLSDGCANSLSSTYNVYSGTPQIVSGSQTVNGQTPQSPNYITSSGAFLVVQTLGTTQVQEVNWTIDGGAGTIYPNGGTGQGNSCNAFTSNFMRVTATSFNACGNGSSVTFYLQRSDNLGYRLSSSPNKDKLLVNFDYKEEAQDLLEYVTLYDDKSCVVTSFKRTEQTKEYFNNNNTVELDVAKLPKSVYFLHVKMGDNLIKQQVELDQ